MLHKTKSLPSTGHELSGRNRGCHLLGFMLKGSLSCSGRVLLGRDDDVGAVPNDWLSILPPNQLWYKRAARWISVSVSGGLTDVHDRRPVVFSAISFANGRLRRRPLLLTNPLTTRPSLPTLIEPIYDRPRPRRYRDTSASETINRNV
jgi:hypothetical protein